MKAVRENGSSYRIVTVLGRAPLQLYSAVVFIFLILPILVVFPLSFTPTSYLVFPPPGLSLRWYERFFNDYAWMQSIWRSLKIGGLTTVLAIAIGIPLSFALVRTRFRGASLVEQVVSAPIIVPHIVYSVSIFGVFFALGLVGPWYGVALAHTVLALPFVVIVVMAGLRSFDRNLELAAMGLGASRLQAVLRITLPSVAPSIVTATFLAFITSFDELVVAMFLAGADATLPKKMFESIMTAIDPTVAAVSVVQIVIVSLLLVIVALAGGKLIGPEE